MGRPSISLAVETTLTMAAVASPALTLAELLLRQSGAARPEESVRRPCPTSHTSSCNGTVVRSPCPKVPLGLGYKLASTCPSSRPGLEGPA